VPGILFLVIWSQPLDHWLMLAFSVALTTAGSIGLVSHIRELLHALASRRWPQTEAEVLAVSVEERRGARGRIRFEPVVRYRYVQDGTTREATRLAFGTLHAGNRSEADQLVAQLKAGARGLIRVCPRRPEMTVLAPGPNRYIWFGLAFFSVYAAFAVSFLVDALKPFLP
jgi:hypothetical protein